MPLEIKRIDPDAFDSLKDEWNDLLSRSAAASVFLRWEWVHSWWKIFKQEKQLFILTARRDGRLLGIAPFYLEPSHGFGPRVLKFCSEELSPDYQDVIVESGQESLLARELINHLFVMQKEWDVLDFDNLRADSPLATDASLLSGYRHRVHLSNQCPYIALDGTFENYFKTRRKLTHLRSIKN